MTTLQISFALVEVRERRTAWFILTLAALVNEVADFSLKKINRIEDYIYSRVLEKSRI